MGMRGCNLHPTVQWIEWAQVHSSRDALVAESGSPSDILVQPPKYHAAANLD